MRETPQLKHIEQVSDGWIKKYILTYVLPDGSDYIYEAASRKGLEAYRAELARLEARSNTAIAAIDEGVPAPVLTTALYARFASRHLFEFGAKVLSAMRKQFGGHDEKPDA